MKQINKIIKKLNDKRIRNKKNKNRNQIFFLTRQKMFKHSEKILYSIQIRF